MFTLGMVGFGKIEQKIATLFFLLLPIITYNNNNILIYNDTVISDGDDRHNFLPDR